MKPPSVEEQMLLRPLSSNAAWECWLRCVGCSHVWPVIAIPRGEASPGEWDMPDCPRCEMEGVPVDAD